MIQQEVLAVSRPRRIMFPEPEYILIPEVWPDWFDVPSDKPVCRPLRSLA